MLLADLNREATNLLAAVYPDSAEFEVECLLKFYYSIIFFLIKFNAKLEASTGIL